MVLLAGIVSAFWLKKNGYLTEEILFAFLNENKTIAPLVFILIFPVLMALFVPTLPMNVGAGFLWGPVYGTLYTIIGATLGFATDFLIARYIGKEFFSKKMNFKAWKWVLNQVDKKGWRVVMFIRINPVFPSNIFSYLFGITSISFKEYIISSAVAASLPAIVLASLGSSAREFFMMGNPKGVITGIFIAFVALIIFFAIRPAINKMFPNLKKIEEQGRNNQL